MVSTDIQCAFYDQLHLLVAKHMTQMLILSLGVKADFFPLALALRPWPLTSGLDVNYKVT